MTATPDPDSAYTGLVAAVIVQAFRDLRKLTSPDGHSPETVRDLAWAWLHHPVTYARDYSTESDPKKQKLKAYHTRDPWGFEWCCTVLDLDPEFYRQRSMTREGINSILGKHGSNQYGAK